jgi:hypothetical protein
MEVDGLDHVDHAGPMDGPGAGVHHDPPLIRHAHRRTQLARYGHEELLEHLDAEGTAVVSPQRLDQGSRLVRWWGGCNPFFILVISSGIARS